MVVQGSGRLLSPGTRTGESRSPRFPPPTTRAGLWLDRIAPAKPALEQSLLLSRLFFSFGRFLRGLAVLGFGATAFVSCAAVRTCLAPVRGVVRWRRRWVALPAGVALVARRWLALPGIRLGGSIASSGSRCAGRSVRSGARIRPARVRSVGWTRRSLTRALAFRRRHCNRTPRRRDDSRRRG